MNYYYKILLNLHRKPIAIYMSFDLPLHSTYHKAYAKAYGGRQWPVQIVLIDFGQVLDEIHNNINEDSD
jgi:hypothetical protein